MLTEKQVKRETDMLKEVLGVKLDLLSKQEVLNAVRALLDSPEKRSELLCTTNAEFIMLAQKDAEFREIINTSFLSVPDGIGTLYATYYLEHVKTGCLLRDFWGGVALGFSNSAELGERISGVDLTHDICKLAEEEGYSVFLLGGWPTDFWGRSMKNPSFDLAGVAAAELKSLYPKLNVVGATSRFSHRKKDDVRTLAFIHKKMAEASLEQIDILFVCYGQSNQEKWISRNAHLIPAKLSIGVGGTFDYIAGQKRRAPKWLQRMNLEWLHRLLTQPWRVRRVFTSFPVFPFKVFFSQYKS